MKLALLGVLCAVVVAGCDGTTDDVTDVSFSAAFASAPAFAGHLSDRAVGSVRVKHPGNGTVVEIGRSRGTFNVPAGGVSKVASQFTKGSYVDEYTIFRIQSDLVEHYHDVALLRFDHAGAGTACVLLNGTFNLGNAKVVASFSVLGGTGAGAKVRMTGSTTASTGGAQVAFSGHGKLLLGAQRAAPAECRGL